MELKRELQAIIERTWVLHDGLSDQIIKNGNNFYSRFCPQHGPNHCHIAKTTPFQEEERLIAIRDSLREVGDVLMLLQRIQCWQPKDRDAALTRLEESRLALMAKIAEYQGPPLDVVRELKTCFRDAETTGFTWKLNEKGKNKTTKSATFGQEKKSMTSFLVCCVGMALNPWKWHKSVGILANLMIISASISSTVNFYHSKHTRRSSSQGKFLKFVDASKDARRVDTHNMSSQRYTLDVFYGRG
ncbi:hypothetical protein Tsubulata_043459 [Turnera subulata]|uniref:Uncharacterized protein n=1 Tax=Turnera subulata TaxID=218843 RepID=A0A9Q0JQI5_9ROSI|nr:hypothetical protein Tsubulata_043459 [Turnera subulata]